MESGNVFWEDDSKNLQNTTQEKAAFVNGVDNQNILRNFLNKKPTKQTPLSNQCQPIVTKKSKSDSILPTNSTNQSTMVKEELNSLQSTNKPACLKDLRPEDKLRIAELIKELARVGESKEKAHTMLQKERDYFTEQINQLLSQKESILEDRKSIMTEYKECQRLLSQYQQQITSQQKKLASDINKLLTPRPQTQVKKKSFFEALQDERESIDKEDEKLINEEVVVTGMGEDLDTLDLTELLDHPVCKNSVKSRNEILRKKKESLLKEQKRLQEILKSQESEFQMKRTDTCSEKGTQITPPPPVSPIKQSKSVPDAFSFGGDHGAQTDLFGTPSMNMTTGMTLRQKTLFTDIDNEITETISSQRIAHDNRSQEYLARRNASSQLSCAQETVSSQSRHKTESTIPMEDDETLSELVDTLNNSTLSVTLKKSSSDSGHHSLNKTPPKNPRVCLQFADSIPIALKTPSKLSVTEFVDPEIDDSQLLEEIFFIK